MSKEIVFFLMWQLPYSACCHLTQEENNPFSTIPYLKSTLFRHDGHIGNKKEVRDMVHHAALKMLLTYYSLLPVGHQTAGWDARAAQALWQLNAQASKQDATTGNTHILKCAGVSIRLHTWVLEFEYHVIFTSWNSICLMFLNWIGHTKAERVRASVVSDSFVTPWTSSSPGSSVRGTLQAKVLGWVTIPFSRGSSWLRNRTWVSCIAGRFFIVWATRVDLL